MKKIHKPVQISGGGGGGGEERRQPIYQPNCQP